MMLVFACMVVMGAFVYTARLYLHVAEAWVAAYAQGRTAPAAPTAPTIIPIPQRVLAIVSRQNEDWAREQVAERARELYAETNDWETVVHQLELESA